MLIKKSNSGAIVVAIVSQYSEYYWGLINLISKKIDKEFAGIGDLITGQIKDRIHNILDELVVETLPIKLIDIIDTLWIPIRTKLEKYIQIDIEREMGEWIKQANSTWNDFIRKVKIDENKSSLDYLIEREVAYACASGILKNDVSPATIRACLMLYTMIKVPCPPLELIEQLINNVGKTEFAELFRAEVDSLRNKITPLEYSKIFSNVLKKVDLNSLPIDELVTFITPGIFREQKLIKILMERFRDISDYLYYHLMLILKRNEIISRAYSITSYDEFKGYLNELKKDVNDAEIILEKYVRTSRLKKLLGLAPRGKEVNKAILEYFQVLETLLFLQTLMLSPVLDRDEKFELILDMIEMYNRYFKKLVKESFPIFITTIINVFQSIGISLSKLYEVYDKQRAVKIIDDFTNDVVSILRAEPVRLKNYEQLLTSMLASITTICLIEGKFIGEILEILYRVISSIDIKIIEAWREIIPYNYIAISLNLSSIFASLSALIFDDVNKGTYIVKALDFTFNALKWLLTRGKALKDSILIALETLNSSLEFITTEDFKRMVHRILDFIEIITPDKKKYAEDYVSLIERVINITSRYAKLHEDAKLDLLINELKQSIEEYKT